MRVRSPGSLVTTGAWWRTAVTMTIASTTLAVPEAAQATPAARPVALVVGEDVAGLEYPGVSGAGGRRARPGPGRRPGRAVGSARWSVRRAGRGSLGCAVRRLAARPCRRRWLALPGGPVGLVVDQPRLDQELAGALAGCRGKRPCSLSYSATSSRAASRPAACRAAARAFSVAASASHADTGLPSSGGGGLDRFLDLGRD